MLRKKNLRLVNIENIGIHRNIQTGKKYNMFIGIEEKNRNEIIFFVYRGRIAVSDNDFIQYYKKV